MKICSVYRIAPLLVNVVFSLNCCSATERMKFVLLTQFNNHHLMQFSVYAIAQSHLKSIFPNLIMQPLFCNRTELFCLHNCISTVTTHICYAKIIFTFPLIRYNCIYTTQPLLRYHLSYLQTYSSTVTVRI